MRKSLAIQLDCTIQVTWISVGLASSDHSIEVYGTTTCELRFLMTDKSHKVFAMSFIVVESHTDQINLSINWLKANNISLQDRTDCPVCMIFNDNRECMSISKISTPLNILQQQSVKAEVTSIFALTKQSGTTTEKSLSDPPDAEIITTTLSYPRLFCPPDYHQVGKSCYAIAFFQALG